MNLTAFAERLAVATRGMIERAVEPVQAKLAQLEAAIHAIPAGAKGDKGDKGDPGAGRDGKDGVDGKPGRDGVDGKDGRDGVDGKDGVNGKDGAPGRDGKDGAPGADGRSVTVDEVMPALEAAFAKWALEVERRAMDLFQRTAAAMPVPQDGLSVDDLAIEHDGDGGVTFRFVRGELRKEFTIQLPRFKDCGVYREGAAYRKGDGVTWGGSFWLSQQDAPEGKPDAGNGHWRLAVKRGRDGKDGK